ncbi:MAG: pyridoxal phosphate-dependent aminotransferase [Flavobacteriales bacterium]|jgi:aspartate aminotransferase|nr:pyridoxal phosphate-dependent aminotransferase [Flavobacteriaceae bacterium]MDO7603736.1 pyridoxal phosphate-dependent aminotransferase [Flavobacteriaceae bacterium]MDO7616492.1 pyridoxal phosphate-dependent aminotransferase [Flavobacteriaceae bacterium]|tara:strand:- start:559 stop:1752 length:1194 start_codon:yes stop_codon:yes gene_type:complete
MPVLSEKGENLPASPIRKLVQFADQAKARGTYVYHLNIGQPDIDAPKEALEVIQNSNLKLLPYGASEGSLSFRKSLCTYFAKNKIAVDPQDIIVTTGASEAVAFTFYCIADVGDEIIIPEPFYANYSGFAAASNINVIPVISLFENQFCLPPIESIEAKITSRTKAILICNPSNPTGYLYSKEEIEKLGDLAIKHNIFLIIDEVYREFIHDDETEHYSVLESRKLADHAIMIDSVSKRYSLCGARVGCLVSKNKALIANALKFAHLRLSPATYALLASEAAINSDSSYLLAVKKEYTARKKTLISSLEKIDGVRVSNPKGAFYCIVELPVDDAELFSKWMLTDFTDNNETVMFAPAAGFYSSPGYGKKQIRIGFVLNEQKLLRATEILEKALKTYSN